MESAEQHDSELIVQHSGVGTRGESREGAAPHIATELQTDAKSSGTVQFCVVPAAASLGR